MAYGLKYQSDFYNFFGRLVSVKLYKKDYTTPTYNIRTQSVQIDWNYQDDDTPVGGTGAKITIVNDTGTYNYFEDLMTGYEKDFKCVIEYNSVIVFEGFNVPDLFEQSLLGFSTFTIQFTNYLKRLENNYISDLDDINQTTRMLSLVENILWATELQYSLYLNSTLFDKAMDDSSPYTFMWQLWLRNYAFYNNQDEWDNSYDVLNKTLKSFGAFLYSWGQKWIIERWGDINGSNNWIRYDYGGSPLVGNAISTLKETISKLTPSAFTANPTSGFIYTDTSQIVSYNSGYQKVKLSLQEQACDTQVFNNFDAGTIISTSSEFPISLSKNTWYYNENLTNLEDGVVWDEMSRWFHWHGNADTSWQYRGLYYKFYIAFNSASKPTDLSVDFKVSMESNWVNWTELKGRFYILVSSGSKANYFVYEDTDGVFKLSATTKVFEVTVDKNSFARTINISKTIDLVDIYADLGSPAEQDFVIGFLPYYYKLTNWYLSAQMRIGDAIVRVNPENIDNEISGTINQNFTKELAVDLDFFDLPNVNYNNGLKTDLDRVYTSGWYTGNDDSATGWKPLTDIYLRDKYQKYSRTMLKLKASILADRYMKPFTILTDGDITFNGAIPKFIVNGYTWDLVQGKYDIEADEYPDTQIIIS